VATTNTDKIFNYLGSIEMIGYFRNAIFFIFVSFLTWVRSRFGNTAGRTVLKVIPLNGAEFVDMKQAHKLG